ncbi:MAG: helix-turn-helix domain-containing protein [Candidatus Cryptobacteroides sp.]
MNITYRIRRFIIRSVTFSGLPDFLKIFLFGVDGKTACAYERLLRMKDLPEDATVVHRKRIDYGLVDRLVREWMADEENILRDFTLGSMSEDIGVSPRALSRYFSLYLAQDFRLWKNNLKIKKAMELLVEQPDYELSEIASAVGFPDKSNFYRQFRLIAGCTPGVWKSTGGHPDIAGSEVSGPDQDTTGARG